MDMVTTARNPGVAPVNERVRVLQRLVDLKSERESWLAHWQDLNDYILPRRLRYLVSERNNGAKRNDKIINNKATKCARTLGAGKMAAQTSPARPWYRYAVPKAVIGDVEAIEAVADLESEMYACMARSNFYPKIHELWFLQGVFATAVIYIEEDDEDEGEGAARGAVHGGVAPEWMTPESLSTGKNWFSRYCVQFPTIHTPV